LRSEVDEKMAFNPDFVSSLYASLSHLNDAGEPAFYGPFITR